MIKDFPVVVRTFSINLLNFNIAFKSCEMNCENIIQYATILASLLGQVPSCIHFVHIKLVCSCNISGNILNFSFSLDLFCFAPTYREGRFF